MTNGTSDATVWLVIVVLGIGTFLIRWSFLGALGNRDMPPWVLRMLRYTPVAVLPALGLRVGGWIDFDQAFVVFATLLGATTLTLGWRRHRAFHAWLLLVPGLVLVWVGAFTRLHDHSMTHVAVMTAGGLLLAAAHLVNLRLTHARSQSTTA